MSILYRFLQLAWLSVMATSLVGCTKVLTTPVNETTPPISTLDLSAYSTEASSAIEITDAYQTQPSLSSLLLEIPAPSLKDNLLGDSDIQLIHILLPPSYQTSEKRFPVIYFLSGFGGSVDESPFDVTLAGERMQQGDLDEMIIVLVSGENALGGSFYVNSSVTGNWEDFIVQDVVGFVDLNFRTLPEAVYRGIAGHSMGGFGAFTLAMRHPDLFGAIYCLSSGFFDQNGLEDSHMFASDKRIEEFFQAMDEVDKLPFKEALWKIQKYEGALEFSFAYGAAFAPNPKKPPAFLDYPYRRWGGVFIRDKETWKRWEAGFGDLANKVKQYRENLLQLNGIVIDYGTLDQYEWIPRGSEYLARLLAQAGIPKELTNFKGGHHDRLGERLLEVMLPFFTGVFDY